MFKKTKKIKDVIRNILPAGVLQLPKVYPFPQNTEGWECDGLFTPWSLCLYFAIAGIFSLSVSK